MTTDATETFKPIQEPLPPDGLTFWLLPDDAERTLVTISLAGALLGTSPEAIRTLVRKGVLRIAQRDVGGWAKVRLSDLQRISGKTFTLLDLHRAEAVRAARIARSESQRKPRKDASHAAL
jgi:hypothetical protein